jgi:hypothetical protein
MTAPGTTSTPDNRDAQRCSHQQGLPGKADALEGFRTDQRMCDTRLTLDAPGAAKALAQCYSVLRRWAEETVRLNAATDQHDSEPHPKMQEVGDAE